MKYFFPLNNVVFFTKSSVKSFLSSNWR